MKRFLAVAAFSFLVLGGCGSSRVYLNRDLMKVAVMIPFDMQTQGVGNGVKAWKHIQKEMTNRGYACVPWETLEKWYVEHGFTGATEQIQGVPVAQICKELGVEGVVLSDLPTWGKVTLGVYNEIKVKIVSELHDKDDAVLWKGEGEYGDSNVNAGSGKRSLIGALVDTAVKAATDPDVYADDAAAIAFRSLPWAGYDPKGKK